MRAEAGRTECWSSVDARDVSPFTVETSSSAVEVRVPEGTDLVIGTTSGKVTVEGRVGAVAVVTSSGRVSIDHARSVDARTKSGRVHVGYAEGPQAPEEVGCPGCNVVCSCVRSPEVHRG